MLAIEYAIRHLERVSHLMSTAHASSDDFRLLRQDRLARAAVDIERLQALAAETGYREGDPQAVTAYYRVHFRRR